MRSDGDIKLWSLFCVFLSHQWSHFVIYHKPCRHSLERASLGEDCSSHVGMAPLPPSVSVVVFSCLRYQWCRCVWKEQRFWWDLGFEGRCSPDNCRPLHMWPFAVTVLPCQASACDRWPLALAVGVGVHVRCPACTWGAIAAAVGVHPG